MYEIPSQEDVIRCIITKEVVEKDQRLISCDGRA